jgi:hypothetical protein
MLITEHTVQDHFKSVFGKTSVNNRRALLATALGTRSAWRTRSGQTGIPATLPSKVHRCYPYTHYAA